MHDPKLDRARGRSINLALAYQTDAAPGRHTAPHSVNLRDKALSAAGMCGLGEKAFGAERLGEALTAVTGIGYTSEDLEAIGNRIACLRQAFNLREGFTPQDFRLPGRVTGHPPLPSGPLAGISLDMERAASDYFTSRDWDPKTGRPSRELLEELGGLEEVIADLYGS